MDLTFEIDRVERDRDAVRVMAAAVGDFYFSLHISGKDWGALVDSLGVDQTALKPGLRVAARLEPMDEPTFAAEHLGVETIQNQYTDSNGVVRHKHAPGPSHPKLPMGHIHHYKTGEMRRRTFSEWNDFAWDVYGWRVVDPDGFDRTALDFHTRLYDVEDFTARAGKSTIERRKR